MSPEVAAAIEIADKHLAGRSTEVRMALAKDIVQAIGTHAQEMAAQAIKQATAIVARKQ